MDQWLLVYVAIGAFIGFFAGMLGMGGKPALRGVDDALLLARRHRIGGVIEAAAGLDLDERDQVAPLRHDVDLAGIMGTRDAAICREMTKLHEDIRRAPIAELAQAADTLETRGEFVLVIGPPAAGAQIMAKDDLDNLLRHQLARHSVKDAVAHAVEMSWRPRREIYARALELKQEGDQQALKGAHDQV